jgi:putative ABC transport system ATP-binding protein
MIRLEGVSKSYGTVGRAIVPALHEVYLSIGEGEMVALVGQSGSGTSTLLNILGCLDTPTAGRYFLNGQDLSGLSNRALTKVRATTVGFAFQLAELSPDTNVLRNVELPPIFSVRPRVLRQRALRALERVGMAGHATYKPHDLSPVQYRRAIIARALINNPVVLLQDEPTADLDDSGAAEIMTLLDSLNGAGMTIVFSTHDRSIARHALRIFELPMGESQAHNRRARDDAMFRDPGAH